LISHSLATIKRNDHNAETFLPVAMNLRGREEGVRPELDEVASMRSASGGSSRSYVAAPLEASDGHHGYSSPRGDGADNLIASTLSQGSNPNSNMAGRRREDDENIVAGEVGVRRLTPRECERLQALPDDWTAFGADSKRYAALGDAVTATVAEWVGGRILLAAGSSLRGEQPPLTPAADPSPT
jgi:DNA (cytosine-5)-methyltransferase 1